MIFIAYDGQVITQKFTEKIWRVATAAKASVFWMQNPDSILEATASSLISSNV